MKITENERKSAIQFLQSPGSVFEAHSPEDLQEKIGAIYETGTDVQPEARKWLATQFGMDAMKAAASLKPTVSGVIVKDERDIPIVSLEVVHGEAGTLYRLLNKRPVITEKTRQISAKLFGTLGCKFEEALHDRIQIGKTNDRSDLLRQMVVFALNSQEFSTHTQRDII